VPYLGRGKQDDTLKAHLEKHFAEGKADLATAFVMRCLDLCDKGGTTALVTPQNWLFLSTYTKLRERLLKEREWNIIARLGPKGFQTPMWDFNIQLGVISAVSPNPSHLMAGIDVTAAKQPNEKAALLRGDLPADVRQLPQAQQRENPDARIADLGELGDLLSAYAGSFVGLQNNDSPKNLACIWEVVGMQHQWTNCQMPVESAQMFGGMDGIVRWPAQPEYLVKGREAWGKRGLSYNRILWMRS